MDVLRILLPVYVVSLLLYGIVSSLMPLFLLSYLAGLLPAHIFLRSMKKNKMEPQKRNLLDSLPVVFTIWFQVILTMFLGNALLSGLPEDVAALVLSYYLVALSISLMFLGTFLKRKQGIQVRNLLITLLALPIVWIVFVLGAGSSILSGGLHLKTGLYTVDSILEGSIYDFVQSISHLFLPALTLGIVLSGVFLRLTRTNMIETLRLDYVTAAKARGLRRSTVTYGYALRNAFLPVLTMIGLQFAALLGGAVLTETTFSWPGLGRYIVDRINSRDYTAIQGAVTVFGVLVMIVGLAVDLLYAYLDPRIRL
jgi:ABC-type dipeptide/oligopeptide/nickel transport system permease component